MKRRDFLKYSLGGLFALCSNLGGAFASSLIPAQNRWAPNIIGDNFSFLAIGDMGTGWKTQYDLVAQMSKFDATYCPAVLLLGDIIYPSAKKELINSNFIKPFQPMLSKGMRFYPVWGNHDWLEEKAIYLKEYFVAPDYYTFTIGPSQFWTLNSNNFDAKQQAWLSQSLQKSRASWKIVLLHHSPYSSGAVHHSSSNLINSLSPILSQNKVDLCLSGHNHLYERSQKINGVTYVVSGGGSASLHGFDQNVNFARAFIKPCHHFLHAFGNADTLTLNAIDSAGNTFDRLSLRKSREQLF
jgi:predicted phosphodiesterase